MKTASYYLILAIAIGTLCVPAPGEVEFPHSEQPWLIGQANPTLTGIEKVYIELRSDTRISHVGITTLEDIHEKVERRLDKANIKIISRPFLDSRPKPFLVPELRIDIATLKLEDSQQYVFRIQTSLSRPVYLAKDSSWSTEADVWKVEPTMQAVSVQSMPAAVTNVVLEQVEAFITAYLLANSKGGEPANTNDITAVTAEEKAKPAVKAPAAKYKNVASKNSKVFHKPDCSSTRRIKPENLTDYNSRAEAIKAGKRGCKICKP